MVSQKEANRVRVEHERELAKTLSYEDLYGKLGELQAKIAKSEARVGAINAQAGDEIRSIRRRHTQINIEMNGIKRVLVHKNAYTRESFRK